MESHFSIRSEHRLRENHSEIARLRDGLGTLRSKYASRACSFALIGVLSFATTAVADSGKPVAVRWWGQAMVSIETYWNLQIVIDPYPPTIGYDDPRIGADLVLITHEHSDHNHAQIVRGEPHVERGLDDRGNVRTIHHVLHRAPNEERPSWLPASREGQRLANDVVVRSVASWHDDEQGGSRGANAIFVVDVDGVRIAHCGDLGQERLSEEQLAELGSVDVLLVPIGGVYTIDGRQAAELVAQIEPRFAVPIHFKTAALNFDLHGVEPFVATAQDRFELTRVEHNTLAVRAMEPNGENRPKIVLLDYEPWQPSGELAELFTGKEKASRESQAVFRPLSATQMNFRPANGTHTPRWNAEHMMGRELLFFTQIFATRDEAITPIDLNPSQMPADYRPAHDDWTGAEEARQLERVGALVRRFAYLLDGIDLDEPAPGSRWTLRGLFRQMARHYDEHTANVRKKFDMPDWPRE